MSAPYSQDLRLRVLAAVDSGMSKMQVHKMFQVSRSTIDDWVKLRQRTGAVAPAPRPCSLGRRAIPDMKVFEAFAHRHRHATLGQMRRAWQEEQGQLLSEMTFSTMLRRLGWTRKKRAGFMLNETTTSAPSSLPV